MNYFITGATGFIGSWVTHFLAEQGNRVTCLIRKTSNLRWIKDLPIELIEGSLFIPESFKEALQKADYVLHIAGVTKALSIQEYYRGNVNATRNLLDAIKVVNPKIKKFVHISSQAAAGPSPGNTALTETSPPHPISDYGKSKLESEKLVLQYKEVFPVTILRPPTVYGPRDTDVFEVFKNISRGFNLQVGRTEQVVSIIHVFDLARGIILAAEHSDSAGEIYFICNDEPVAWSQVTAQIAKVMQKKPITIPIPYPVAYGVSALMELQGRILRKATILNRQKMQEVAAGSWVISNQKIKSELNFEPRVSLSVGLAETWQWYRNMGWLS